MLPNSFTRSVRLQSVSDPMRTPPITQYYDNIESLTTSQNISRIESRQRISSVDKISSTSALKKQTTVSKYPHRNASVISYSSNSNNSKMNKNTNTNSLTNISHDLSSAKHYNNNNNNNNNSRSDRSSSTLLMKQSSSISSGLTSGGSSFMLGGQGQPQLSAAATAFDNFDLLCDYSSDLTQQHITFHNNLKYENAKRSAELSHLQKCLSSLLSTNPSASLGGRSDLLVVKESEQNAILLQERVETKKSENEIAESQLMQHEITHDVLRNKKAQIEASIFKLNKDLVELEAISARYQSSDVSANTQSIQLKRRATEMHRSTNILQSQLDHVNATSMREAGVLAEQEDKLNGFNEERLRLHESILSLKEVKRETQETIENLEADIAERKLKSKETKDSMHWMKMIQTISDVFLSETWNPEEISNVLDIQSAQELTIKSSPKIKSASRLRTYSSDTEFEDSSKSKLTQIIEEVSRSTKKQQQQKQQPQQSSHWNSLKNALSEQNSQSKLKRQKSIGQRKNLVDLGSSNGSNRSNSASKRQSLQQILKSKNGSEEFNSIITRILSKYQGLSSHNDSMKSQIEDLHVRQVQLSASMRILLSTSSVSTIKNGESPSKVRGKEYSSSGNRKSESSGVVEEDEKSKKKLSLPIFARSLYQNVYENVHRLTRLIVAIKDIMINKIKGSLLNGSAEIDVQYFDSFVENEVFQRIQTTLEVLESTVEKFVQLNWHTGDEKLDMPKSRLSRSGTLDGQVDQTEQREISSSEGNGVFGSIQRSILAKIVGIRRVLVKAFQVEEGNEDVERVVALIADDEMVLLFCSLDDIQEFAGKIKKEYDSFDESLFSLGELAEDNFFRLHTVAFSAFRNCFESLFLEYEEIITRVNDNADHIFEHVEILKENLRKEQSNKRRKRVIRSISEPHQSEQESRSSIIPDIVDSKERDFVQSERMEFKDKYTSNFTLNPNHKSAEKSNNNNASKGIHYYLNSGPAISSVLASNFKHEIIQSISIRKNISKLIRAAEHMPSPPQQQQPQQIPAKQQFLPQLYQQKITTQKSNSLLSRKPSSQSQLSNSKQSEKIQHSNKQPQQSRVSPQKQHSNNNNNNNYHQTLIRTSSMHSISQNNNQQSFLQQFHQQRSSHAQLLHKQPPKSIDLISQTEYFNFAGANMNINTLGIGNTLPDNECIPEHASFFEKSSTSLDQSSKFEMSSFQQSEIVGEESKESIQFKQVTQRAQQILHSSTMYSNFNQLIEKLNNNNQLIPSGNQSTYEPTQSTIRNPIYQNQNKKQADIRY